MTALNDRVQNFAADWAQGALKLWFWEAFGGDFQA
jgi:hypothetical protein